MEQKLGDINLMWSISRRERESQKVSCVLYFRKPIYFLYLIFQPTVVKKKKTVEKKKACAALYLSIYIN